MLLLMTSSTATNAQMQTFLSHLQIGDNLSNPSLPQVNEDLYIVPSPKPEEAHGPIPDYPAAEGPYQRPAPSYQQEYHQGDF